MFLFTYTGFILAAVCLVFASYIWSRKPKDLMARYFILYVYMVALWVVSNAFADIAQTPFSLVFWSGTALIGAGWWISFYLCFIDIFMFKSRPKWWRRAFYYFPSIVFTIGAFSKYSVVETIFPVGLPTQIIPGIFYTYLLYFTYAALAYSTVILAWFFIKRAKGAERRQAFFMWFGFAILVAALVYFIIVLPLYYNELRFFNVGPQFTLLMIALSSYTILRHRLFDLQLLVKKGTVFTLLFAIILLFFNSLITLTSLIFPGPATYIVTALVITIIFSPLKTWLEKTTDKLFFRRHLSFHEMIGLLNQALEHAQTPNDFVRQIGTFLQDALKIQSFGLLIVDEKGELQPKTARLPNLKRPRLPAQSAIHEYLEDQIRTGNHTLQTIDRDDLDYRILYESQSEQEKRAQKNLKKELETMDFQSVVPFASDDRVIGLLFLGPKLSGDQLSEPDFRILEALAHEGSITLQKAINTERANRLNELKSEFVRVVSHQLRTPLSSAKWNMDFLMEQKLDPSLTSPMADIQINLSKISDGLTGMLTVMEIAEDRVELQKSAFDLASLTNSVVKSLDALASIKKIRVQAALPEAGVSLEADQDKLRKVLSILLANALMYSAPRTKVEIELSASGKQVRFAIQDRGMGVPKKDRQEIFEKFFRGEEAKKMAPDGLGVSLYIARDFITRHGGKLWVEDRKDGKSGARFVFTLPFDPSPKLPVPRRKTPAAAGKPA